MATAELELPGVAKSKRPDTTIRVDAETAEMIRKVATLRDISIGEYIRSAFLPIVRRDLIAEGKKLAKGDRPD